MPDYCQIVCVGERERKCHKNEGKFFCQGKRESFANSKIEESKRLRSHSENDKGEEWEEEYQTEKWICSHCDLWALHWPCAFYLCSDIQSSLAYLPPSSPYTLHLFIFQSFPIYLPNWFLSLCLYFFLHLSCLLSFCPPYPIFPLSSSPFVLPFIWPTWYHLWSSAMQQKAFGISLIDWKHWRCVAGSRRSYGLNGDSNRLVSFLKTHKTSLLVYVLTLTTALIVQLVLKTTALCICWDYGVENMLIIYITSIFPLHTVTGIQGESLEL